jgi:hypothetical protein
LTTCGRYLRGSKKPDKHVVSPKGVTTTTQKLKAVWKWLLPRDKHELRSFLGLCTYSRFIAGFADIANLLTGLMDGKHTFQWSSEAEAAFQFLKESLCTAPVINTDASNMGIGGTLSQI